MTDDHRPVLDLAAALERDTAHGPSHRPVTDRIAGGRRLARRRRLATAGLSATAAAAVLAVAAVLAPSAATLADPSPAAQVGSQVGSTAPVPADVVAEWDRYNLAVGGTPGTSFWTGEQPGPPFLTAELDSRTGALVVRDGWRVARRVDDPVGRSAGGSLGLVTTDGSREQWLLLRGDTTPGAVAATGVLADESGFGSFDRWLDAEVAFRTGRSTDALVSFSGPATVAAADGVQLLEQAVAGTADGDVVLSHVRVADGPDWRYFWVVSSSTAGHRIADYPGDGPDDGGTVDDLAGRLRSGTVTFGVDR